MGIGRVFNQNFLRITKAIWDKSFFANPALRMAISHVQKHQSTIHIVGLVSTGGVHSYIEHLYALIELFVGARATPVFIHAILDGRDTAFGSGGNFIARLEERLALFGAGRIASIAGRSWAMDRDARWQRIEKAYRAMVDGSSDELFTSATRAIEASYSRGVYDEALTPIALRKEGTSKPIATIKDNDAIVMFNFRPDRSRELAMAFALPGFSKFPTSAMPNVLVVTMTEYDKNLPAIVAFPPENITTSLTKTLSYAGIPQLRIAETEKYAHVTYFFNGFSEQAYPGEDRILVPSVRVDSYDEDPAMAAEEITAHALTKLHEGHHHFIVINYANPDMVAHTGNFEATQQAVTTVDRCLGELVQAVKSLDGTLIVTSDHGNAEDMIDPTTGLRTTTHSANSVPCILVNPAWYGRGGISDPAELHPLTGLSAIAPTILDLLDVPIPQEMTGKRLTEELRLPKSKHDMLQWTQ
jgi:2,3-bisphosphoglycerate-independent phosphoglycerate mutase